jgi:hypothetical protein
MISATDFVHLPYTPDLTRAGIAYTCRRLTHPIDSSPITDFNSLRQLVAQTGVELALKRYLIERKVPFDVLETSPFSDPERVDICLGGRLCLLNNAIITRKDQVRLFNKNPAHLLSSPVLIPPGLFSADLYSPNDLFIVSFVPARPSPHRSDLTKMRISGQDAYLIHALPAIWSNPTALPALGRLAVKSNLSEPIMIELGGLGENREFQIESIELLPGNRSESQHSFSSLGYIHASHLPEGQIGIYNPTHDRSHLLQSTGWGNIWVDGLEIILAGYLESGKILRLLKPTRYSVPEFKYSATRRTLNVSSLRSMDSLFNSVRTWSQKKSNQN